MNGAGRIGLSGDGSKPYPGNGRAKEIGRYGDAKSALPRPRKARMSRERRGSVSVSALIVCAAAILVFSSIAFASVGKGNAADDQTSLLVSQPPPSQLAQSRQPLPPELVQGMVFEADGVTGVPDCLVNVTNTRTGDWNWTYTDPVWGWYEYDMNFFATGWLEGDLINVTAMSNSSTVGWNEGVITSNPALTLEIVLTGTLVPEFPMAVVPVLGLMALFATVSLVRRKERAQ